MGRKGLRKGRGKSERGGNKRGWIGGLAEGRRKGGQGRMLMGRGRGKKGHEDHEVGRRTEQGRALAICTGEGRMKGKMKGRMIITKGKGRGGSGGATDVRGEGERGG